MRGQHNRRLAAVAINPHIILRSNLDQKTIRQKIPPAVPAFFR